DEPDHPLSRIGNEDIRTAFGRFTQTLTDMGIGYSAPGDLNRSALLPAGTTKPTLSVPQTMLPGIEASSTKAKTLIADFVGLQGFCAKEFVANLRASWPGLSVALLEFPDMAGGGQVYAEVMARALEVPAHRERLGERIRAVLGGAEFVGMPAIMGVHAPDKVHAELARLVGVPLF
ncbi:MAG: hypothetical protein GY778_31995, partial [bacterium]|nr:hypothetical protein [bacterium]